MQTLGFARMDLYKIKKARLSNIVALGKGAGLLNSPHKFKEKRKSNGPEGLSLKVPIGSHPQKKMKIKTKTG